MVANYRTFTISAGADENVVDKIYEILQKEGYNNPKFRLQFVGFEAPQGTALKINGNPLKVPSTEYFISPYGEERHMAILKLTFDGGFDGDIYCIY